MPHIEASIEIAAARSEVFRFCHDVESWSEWDQEVQHVELLTPRPLRQGTLVRIDARHAGGAVFTWDAEYVDFQFLNSSRVRVIDAAPSSPFRAGSERVWQFSQVGNGTRLLWTWDYEPKGFLSRLMDRFQGRTATEQAIRRSLVNLKKLLESGRRARPV